MGLFGLSGKDKLKNAISSSQSVTNTAMSGSTTKQRNEAHAKADTEIIGDITGEGNSTVKVMSTAEVQQEVKVMKTQTNIINLENDILADIEQKPDADITGGLFSPDIDSDNSLNVSSTAATASANYSYMSVSAMATADAKLKVTGNIKGLDNATVEVGAAAIIRQEVTLEQDEVVTQSGLNTMTTVAEQAPKLVAKDGMVEGMKAIGDTINKAIESVTGMLSGPLMVVAGLVGLAALAKYGGGGNKPSTAATQGMSAEAQAEVVRKTYWKAVLKKALMAFAAACVALAVVVYAHDIWDSKYNLLKYPAKWLGFKGIPEIPDKYMWVISVVYGGATLGLHAIYKKT